MESEVTGRSDGSHGAGYLLPVSDQRSPTVGVSQHESGGGGRAGAHLQRLVVRILRLRFETSQTGPGREPARSQGRRKRASASGGAGGQGGVRAAKSDRQRGHADAGQSGL